MSDLDAGDRRLQPDVLLPFFGPSQNLGPMASCGRNIERIHVAAGPAGLFPLVHRANPCALRRSTTKRIPAAS